MHFVSLLSLLLNAPNQNKSLGKAGGDEDLEMKYVDFKEKLTHDKRIVLIGWPSEIPLKCPSSLLRHQVKLLIDRMLSKPPQLRFKKLTRAQYARYVSSDGEDWVGDEEVDEDGSGSDDDDDLVRAGKKRKGHMGRKLQKSRKKTGGASLAQEKVNDLPPIQRPALQNTTDQLNTDFLSTNLPSTNLLSDDSATFYSPSSDLAHNSFPLSNVDSTFPTSMSRINQFDDCTLPHVFQPNSSGEYIFTDEYMASVVEPNLANVYF